MAESTEAVAHAVALDDSLVGTSVDAAVFDALRVELPFGGKDAFLAEVAGVVVGLAEEVVARIGKQMCVSGWCAEGIDVGPFAFGAFAAVEQCSLEVANGEVSRLQNRLHIAKQVSAFVGGQRHAGVGSAHHDIAGESDGERVG